MKADNFTDILFVKENLDRYIVRTSILNAITGNLKFLSYKNLDIGCGKMPYKEYIINNSKVQEYIGLDISSALIYNKEIQPDFTWDGISMPFKNDSFDSAIATEVLEHCPDPEIVLNETNRVLRPGGFFFFTVPFLWPLHETPHDEYRYTPWSLKRHLENAGFVEIEIQALGGWHAAMAQMVGLWVRRSPLSSRTRNFLSWILRPLIKMLLKMENKTTVSFKEGQMITGLYGTAQKKK